MPYPYSYDVPFIPSNSMNDDDALDYEMQYIDWMGDRATAMEKSPLELQHDFGLSKESVESLPIAELNEQCERTVNSIAALESINQEIAARGTVTLANIRRLERISPGIIYGNPDIDLQFGSGTTHGLVAGNEFINPFSILKWGILAVIIVFIARATRAVLNFYKRNIQPSVKAGKKFIDIAKDNEFIKRAIHEFNELGKDGPVDPPSDDVASIVNGFSSNVNDFIAKATKSAVSDVISDQLKGFDKSVKSETAGTFNCNQRPENERLSKQTNEELRRLGCPVEEQGYSTDVKTCFIELGQFLTSKDPRSDIIGKLSIGKVVRLDTQGQMSMLANLGLAYTDRKSYASPMIHSPLKALEFITRATTGLGKTSSLIPLLDTCIEAVADGLNESNPDWEQIARRVYPSFAELRTAICDAIGDMAVPQTGRRGLFSSQNIDIGTSTNTIIPLVFVNDNEVKETVKLTEAFFGAPKSLPTVNEMTNVLLGGQLDALVAGLRSVNEQILQIKEMDVPDRISKRLNEIQKLYDPINAAFAEAHRKKYPSKGAPLYKMEDGSTVYGPYELGTVLRNLTRLMSAHRTMVIAATSVVNHVSTLYATANRDATVYNEFASLSIELMTRLKANKELFDEISHKLQG